MGKKRLLRAIAIFIAFVLFSTVLPAQTKSISGIIKDEKGAGLPGATVSVRDTKAAVTTDAEGKFTLTLPAGAKILVVSFIGMQRQEIAIRSKTSFEVVLKPLSTILNDVVVVGYGTVRKTDLTGSVQKIGREDLIKDAPTNALQAMQGKLAGVNVTQNDGAPGAALSIRIRGSNSFLGGTEPLYVIDGVPFNNSSTNSTPASIGFDEKQTLNALSFINPNDIESIDVLKDASATAIYGSRGANGVVLITTRKGRGGKDKVELNMNMGVSQVSKRLTMLNAQDFATYQNLSYTNANLYGGASYTKNDFPYPGDSLPGATGNYYKLGPADYAGRGKDWQDEIFRRGLYQNYSVNISGGNDAGNHSLSFNYLKQDGAIINSNYRRFSLNLNLNRNVGKIFKIGTSTSVAHSLTNGVKTGTDKSDDANAGVIRSALTFPPTIDTVQAYDGQGQGFFITNPVIYARDVLNRVTGINIFSSNYVEAAITPSFKFRQNLGINYATNKRDQYYPTTVYEGKTVGGDALKSDDSWSSVISESMLTFTHQYGKHSITAFGASTYERTNGQWNKYEAQNFTSDLLQNENLGAGQTQLAPRGNRYQSTLISFLGRVNYTYNDCYLLTASFRRDGSSKFGKNNKWSNFPSLAFAWKAINEKFIAGHFNWLSDLKLRASWGQTGNQGIGSYSSLSKLAIYRYPFNGGLQTGYADDYYSGPANADLRWETTTAFNIGVDFGFLNNRLNLHVDAYRKKTDDLLQYLTTPLSSGFPKKLVNSGSVENKGLELALDAGIVRHKDFEWNTNFNISFNRNKILTLATGVEQQYAENISTNDAPFIQKADHPIGALYGWVEDGYYDNDAEVRSNPLYSSATDAVVRKQIGEIKYRDSDGDPTALTDKDRTFIGNVNPKYTLGFTNNFRYKSWDLSVFVNSVQGNDIINMNTRFMANLGDFKNVTVAMRDGAWTTGKDNSQATGPKVWRQYERNIKFTRRFIEDGSFVRLKNVTVGYNIKTHISGMQSLRVSLGVNNLVTMTHYTGYDPEMNSYGDNPALYGVDLGGYPNARTYNFTVRCNF